MPNIKLGPTEITLPPYCPRKLDTELRQAVWKFTIPSDSNSSQVLVINGSPGIGKTSLIRAFLNESFLQLKCGIMTSVYFNLAPILRHIPPGERDSFLTEALASNLNISADNLDQNADEMVLLVFDHIPCLESLKFVAKMAKYRKYRCIVVGAELERFNEAKLKTYDTLQLGELSLVEKKALLNLSALSSKLSALQTNSLANCCGGHPLVIYLIQGIVMSSGKQLPDHLSNQLMLANQLRKNDSAVVDDVGVILKLTFEHESLLTFTKRYFCFLLFPPGEMVQLADLALLWNCADFDEALQFCREAYVSKNMLCEFDNFQFQVHPVIHQATLKYARSKYGKSASKLLMNFLLRGAAKKHLERRKGEHVLHLTIRLRRFRLFEAIIGQHGGGINVLPLLLTKTSKTLSCLSLLLMSLRNDIEIVLKLFERIASIPAKGWLTRRRRMAILSKIHQALLAKSLGTNDRLITTLARRGFVHASQYLLEEYQPMTAEQIDCHEALVRAVCSENLKLVRILLKNGANPDAISASGRSVLHHAISLRQVYIVKELLEHSANPNSRDSVYSETALIEASRLGSSSLVDLLMQFKANPDMRNLAGETALMVSSQNGHQTVTELLLYFKANPNASDNRGRTALMRSCEKGHFSIVQTLLQHGADVNAMGSLSNFVLNREKCTALSLALTNGHFEITKFLLQNGANSCKDSRLGFEALTAAIRTRNREFIKLLLDFGLDANATLAGGKTMLMLACQSTEFSTDFVRTLIEINVDANKIDCNGETALSYCFRAFAANPLFMQNREKLALIYRASSPESYAGKWEGEAQMGWKSSFHQLTRTVSRLEKLAILSVRRLLGPGYVNELLDDILLPQSIKDKVMLND